MKQAIIEAQRTTPASSRHRGRSSVEVRPSVDSMEEFIQLLPAYRGASPLLKEMHKKLKRDPNWRPDDRSLELGLAAIRAVERRRDEQSSIDRLIAIDAGLDLPSALDPDSFDLLD